MLIAFIYLYQKSGSFALQDWFDLPLSLKAQVLSSSRSSRRSRSKFRCGPCTPPPDARTRKRRPAARWSAAVTLKISACGFIRFILPILPDASHYLSPFIIALSLIAVVYIGLVALCRPI
jgi:NADH-quinone oxidoreductase subunit M